MRVLVWNIRQGGSDTSRIIEAIDAHSPNTVVLTEFWSDIRGEKIQAALNRQGLVNQASSNPPNREHGVLVASSSSFTLGDFQPSIPHRAVEAKFEDFTLLALHIPDYGHKWDKPAFWNDVLTYARAHNDDRVLLAGDFNTGFGIDAEGASFKCQKEMKQLVALGWTDAWRTIHPDVREFTWYSRVRNGFRLDYGFLSPAFRASLISAEHSHREREENVSDHSALILELAFRTGLLL